MSSISCSRRGRLAVVTFGIWIGRTISYIIMIYFGNAVLRPFLEIFEDRLVGILLIDVAGIGFFEALNLITEYKSKKVLENKIIMDHKEKKLSFNHPTIKW